MTENDEASDYTDDVDDSVPLPEYELDEDTVHDLDAEAAGEEVPDDEDDEDDTDGEPQPV